MINRDLLARIRKCLALSASSNEHEAAAALAKARALMAEYGVTDIDLAMAEVEESAARGSRTQCPPVWERLLCRAVRRALHVEVVIDENLDRRYFGRGPTPEIAAYAFVALHRRLKVARSEYIRRTLRRCTPARKRVRADAFCEGWASAVLAKIAALAPIQDVDSVVGTYIARRYPELIEVKNRARAMDKARTFGDVGRGLVAGREVDLHRGVNGGAPAMLTDA